MQNKADCAHAASTFCSPYRLKKVTSGTTAAQTHLTGLNAVTAAQRGSYRAIPLLTVLPLHRAGSYRS
jgi:hypothetical protein